MHAQVPEYYCKVGLEATYMAAWDGTPDEIRDKLTSSPGGAFPEKTG